MEQPNALSWPAWKEEGQDRVVLGTGCVFSLVVLAVALGGIAKGWAKGTPGLIVMKMGFEACLAVLWLTGSVLSDDEFCKGRWGVAMAFWSEFFLLGSELLFAAFCLDFLAAISDPFVNIGHNQKISAAAVVLFAAAMGGALVSHEAWYGESFVPICYTDEHRDTSGASWLNLAFFYAPFLCCHLLSIITVIYASMTLAGPLAGVDTTARMRSLRTLQDFVFWNGFVWSMVILLYIPIVEIAEAPIHGAHSSEPLSIIFGLFLFLFGARSLHLTPFCIRMISVLRNGEAEQVDNRPQLSKALQRDVLRYTLHGINGLLEQRGVYSKDLHTQEFRMISPRSAFTLRHDVSRPEISQPLLVNNANSNTSLLEEGLDCDSGEDGSYRKDTLREEYVLVLTISPLFVTLVLSMTMTIVFKYSYVICLSLAVITIGLLATLIVVWRFSKSSAEARERVTLYEHCADLFRDMRGEKLSQAVCESLNASILAQQEFKLSSGRSGAFMFVSSDRRWIIKTIEQSEKLVLLRIAGSLIDYWSKNPHSLLSRIYGIYSLHSFGRVFSLIVMENIIPTQVDAIFDLKGSWIDRTAPEPKPGKVFYCKHCSVPFQFGEPSADQCRLNRTHEPRSLLKDNDFRAAKVLLPLQVTLQLKQQLHCDTRWLSSHNLMDYSLLLGVRDSLVQQSQLLETREHSWGDAVSHLRSGDGLPAKLLKAPALYHAGVIDYLQAYDWRKKCEKFVKEVLLRKSSFDEKGYPGLSAAPPRVYAERFASRVIDEFLVELKSLVQVVRKRDGSPIVTLDVALVTSFEEFMVKVCNADATATRPTFGKAATLLTPENFEHFIELCSVKELTILVVDVKD